MRTSGISLPLHDRAAIAVAVSITVAVFTFAAATRGPTAQPSAQTPVTQATAREATTAVQDKALHGRESGKAVENDIPLDIGPRHHIVRYPPDSADAVPAADAAPTADADTSADASPAAADAATTADAATSADAALAQLSSTLQAGDRVILLTGAAADHPTLTHFAKLHRPRGVFVEIRRPAPSVEETLRQRPSSSPGALHLQISSGPRTLQPHEPSSGPSTLHSQPSSSPRTARNLAPVARAPTPPGLCPVLSPPQLPASFANRSVLMIGDSVDVLTFEAVCANFGAPEASYLPDVVIENMGDSKCACRALSCAGQAISHARAVNLLSTSPVLLR